jgi:thiol-disulfide isomerase/thioredoxin
VKKITHIEHTCESENYKEFTYLSKNLEEAEKAYIILFHGGKGDKGERSWCPGCITALEDFEKFASAYNGHIELFTVSVGTQGEWQKKSREGVRTIFFRRNFPYLQAVPTAVLGKGSLELVKVLEPRIKDFEHLVERFKQYEF